LWDCKQSGKNCPSGATVSSIFCDHLFFLPLLFYSL
jgi:hypothetical protein